MTSAEPLWFELPEALMRTRTFALAVLDDEGRLREANEGFRLLAGLADDPQARIDELVVTAPDLLSLLSTSGLEETSTLYEGPVTIEGPDEHHVDLEASMSVWGAGAMLIGLTDEAGEGVAERLSLLHADIAQAYRERVRELVETEEIYTSRLQDLQRAADLERVKELDRFARHVLNTIGHELGTPMTPINLVRPMLEDPPEGLDDRTRRGLEQVARSLDRLDETIRDILQAVKVARQAMEPTLETVRMEQLLQAAAQTVQARAETRGITVATEVPDPIEVHGDPELVERCLCLLLASAVARSPEGGRVQAVLTTEGEEALVTVSDEGPALSDEAIEGMFRPFERPTGAMRTETAPGLSLYVAKGIVEAHGGTIWAESQGEGATVAFRLPRNPS